MSQLSMRQNLRSLMIADATLFALVAERVYATLAARSAALPFVVVSVAGGSRNYHHGGADIGRQTRLSFDIHGETPTECEQVGDALEALLSGYINTTSGDTHFGAIFFAGEYDAHSPDLATDDNSGVFRKVVDYRVDWQTAASLGVTDPQGVTIGGEQVTIGGVDVEI